jgi:tripartite-type tricarboxylate transporter receptor subunit TctC
MARLSRRGVMGGAVTVAAISKAIVAAAFALAAVTTTAVAQEWPAKTITLVVPFAAGGGIDASARLQAAALGEVLGQTIIVENIGAAAGTVGSARVAKAAPDGYTLLIGNTGTHAYSQSLYKKPPYDAAMDFEPVGLVSESPRILIVRKDLPVNNLQEFMAYATANQSKMQYGSAGVGSGTHLPCALLNMAMGVDITHIPYRGAGPAMQELIGGRIDYMCDTIQTGAAQVKGGTVKGIAVMSPKRVSTIPDLATTGEQGLRGVEATVWNGFFFPKGTPQPIVRKMNKVLGDMIARSDLREKLEALGLSIVPPEQRTPEYLAKYLPQEIERWGKVIRAGSMSMD